MGGGRRAQGLKALTGTIQQPRDIYSTPYAHHPGLVVLHGAQIRFKSRFATGLEASERDDPHPPPGGNLRAR